MEIELGSSPAYSDVTLPQLCTPQLQTQVFHEILPFFISASVSTLFVVADAVITEHLPSHAFFLVGIAGMIFHFFSAHFYTTTSSAQLNPYGGFLVVVWIWLLWGSTSCIPRPYALSTEPVIFNKLSESDLWVAFTCVASEVILLLPQDSALHLLFALNWQSFFFIVPYTDVLSEMLQIQVFLVFLTRYFLVYQVRRFILAKERSFLTDYIIGISGVWVLFSRNFIAILVGIVVCMSIQLLAITLLQPGDKKKN